MKPSLQQRIVDGLNREAPPHHHLSFEGNAPFGAALAIERYTLANGLTILVVVDKSAPTIAYQTWFKVGSRHEHEGKTGLSHLFEHLMFNEMEGMPPGAFDRKMEAAGIENNASTWLDFTQYEETLPKSDLGLVVRLEAHRMGHLRLQQPQLDSEKEVVANERRYRVDDDVEGTIEEALYKLAYERHSYRWPTIGWMEDILAFNVEDLLSFYRDHYCPNNATVVAVGDIDRKKTLKLIAQHYSQFAAAQLPLESSLPEPPQTQERSQTLKLPTPSPKVVVAYHGPALGEPAHLELSLLLDIFAGGRASRLYQKLVREMEICIEVRGDVGPHKHPGLIEFYLSGRPGTSSSAILAAFDACLDELLQQGVFAEELSRARARAELGFYSGIESAAGKASSIGFYETVLGQANRGFSRIEAMAQLSISDLNFSARRFLSTPHRNIIFVEPKTGEEKSA